MNKNKFIPQEMVWWNEYTASFWNYVYSMEII